MTIFDKAVRPQSILERKQMTLLITMTLVALVISFIAVQQWLVALAIALVVPVAFAILARPDMSTLAVMFILYTNAAVIAVRFHNVPRFVGAAVPLLLALPLANYLIVRRQKLILSPTFLLMLLFLVVQLLGSIFAIYLNLAIENTFTFLVEGIVLFFLITNVIRTPEMLRRVIWALLLAGIFIGGLSVFQQVTGTFDNDYWGFAQAGGRGFGTGEETIQGEVRQLRLAGPIGEKNYYAQVMLMLVTLGMSRFWGERSKSLRFLALTATTLSALGMILAFSRGTAVGFALLLMIMVFLRYIKPYQLVVVILGLAVLMIAVPQYAERLISLQDLTQLTNSDSAGVAGTDTAVQGRVGEMWAAGLVFVDHPVIGVGTGMFKYYYQEYADLIGLRVHSGTREAHNLFLDIAAENGALGIACFLAIVGLTLRNLARVRNRWEQQRPDLANMATGFMLALISYLTTGLFLSMAYQRYFWLVLALATATVQVADDVGEKGKASADTNMAAQYVASTSP